MNTYPTPTPIPIDDVPPQFLGYVQGMFQQIIKGLKGAVIPFTHATIWDFILWTIIMAAVIKAVKLIYGKGDSTTHE